MVEKTRRNVASRARPPREKGGPQAGQRGRLFAAGFAIVAYFSCFARLETAGFSVCADARRFALFVYCFRGCVWVCGVVFSSILGVSLSAAARSAAALVYDKLTPNCHFVF